MSGRFPRTGQLLLTGGLLLVLAQGLWQLPDLQDYFFPGQQIEANFKAAKAECGRIEDSLTSLKLRAEYLEWFLASSAAAPKVVAARLLAFPFAEILRPLAPGYFWRISIILAKKDRVNVERKLKYLDAFLDHLNPIRGLECSSRETAIGWPPPPGDPYREQIQKFYRQWQRYSAELKELTIKLNRLEENGYKN